MTVNSLVELPLDIWDGTDGNNSLLGSGIVAPTADELARLQQFEYTHQINKQIRKTQSATASAVYVPFRRNLKTCLVGQDAFAVKRALSKAGFGEWGKWGVRNLYGPYAAIHTKGFQKKNHQNQTGVYDLATHQKLSRFFDSYGAYLMRTYKIKITTDQRRDNVVSAAMFGYHNAPSIHYTQSSLRMYGVRNSIKPPGIPRYEDCSSFATWCYWIAGLADPNGLGYNGQGYTGTLTRNGKVVSLTQAKPGDLVFYGGSFSVPHHVAIYVGNGRVVSHGSEIGPLFLSVSYRSINHIRSYV